MYKEQNMASVKIPEQKVILCGEFGVGKSSLFRRYMSDSFTTATDRFEEKYLYLDFDFWFSVLYRLEIKKEDKNYSQGCQMS